MLDLSKFRAIADDKYNVAENDEFVFHREEKIVEKG